MKFLRQNIMSFRSNSASIKSTLLLRLEINDLTIFVCLHVVKQLDFANPCC
jgi:hypothetical protein